MKDLETTRLIKKSMIVSHITLPQASMWNGRLILMHPWCLELGPDYLCCLLLFSLPCSPSSSLSTFLKPSLRLPFLPDPYHSSLVHLFAHHHIRISDRYHRFCTHFRSLGLRRPLFPRFWQVGLGRILSL